MRIVARSGRATALGSLVVLGAIAVGVGLLVVAMGSYPGGSSLNPAAEGHSFWFNFLCDLTNDLAVNGRSNQIGARFARVAMATLCLALGGFWFILPVSIHATSRWLSNGIRALGVLSVMGLLIVPVASGTGHVVAVFVSFVPALIAATLALIGTVRHSGSRALVVLGCTSLLVALLDAVLYARSYMVHPRVITPALPLLQRAALLLMLMWMSAVAVRALGYSTTKR